MDNISYGSIKIKTELAEALKDSIFNLIRANLPKMLHDRVLIKPDEVKEDTSLFVNPHEKPKANTGVVVSVGDGFVGVADDNGIPVVLKVPLTVKVGDKVRYDERLFDEFIIDGEAYVDGIERYIKCILN